MISNALNIVIKELNRHLSDNYEEEDSGEKELVKLGNLAEGFSSGGNNPREMLYMSVVNIQEEKTLKNLSCRSIDTMSFKVKHENPPVYINLLILITAAHSEYINALSMLSRAIRFFQSQNFFTQENVAPDSITSTNAFIKDIEKLESFKLIFDLYSPTLEEVNHLWGTLGGKQYPFVLYKVRMLDLQFKAVQKEGGLVTEVISNFSHKEQ